LTIQVLQRSHCVCTSSASEAVARQASRSDDASFCFDATPERRVRHASSARDDVQGCQDKQPLGDLALGAQFRRDAHHDGWRGAYRDCSHRGGKSRRRMHQKQRAECPAKDKGTTSSPESPAVNSATAIRMASPG
jgi:hypothetical protein